MRVRRLTARDLAHVASFAALIAVLGVPGQVSLFGNAVPITMQTFGIMLAGSILGARRGAMAVLVVLTLVALGLPLLAGGRGGLAVFAGPSVGFLIGWPLGAAVTGWLVQCQLPRYSKTRGLAANVIGGIGVVYLVGVPVQATILGTSGLISTAITSLMFLPGDLVKALLATAVAAAVHRGYPRLGEPPADARTVEVVTAEPSSLERRP